MVRTSLLFLLTSQWVTNVSSSAAPLGAMEKSTDVSVSYFLSISLTQLEVKSVPSVSPSVPLFAFLFPSNCQIVLIFMHTLFYKIKKFFALCCLGFSVTFSTNHVNVARWVDIWVFVCMWAVAVICIHFALALSFLSCLPLCTFIMYCRNLILKGMQPNRMDDLDGFDIVYTAVLHNMHISYEKHL